MRAYACMRLVFHAPLLLAPEASQSAAPPRPAPPPSPWLATPALCFLCPPVYFPNISAYVASTKAAGSTTKEQWAESCRAMHPGWQYAFWDEATAMELIDKVRAGLARRLGSRDPGYPGIRFPAA